MPRLQIALLVNVLTLASFSHSRMGLEGPSPLAAEAWFMAGGTGPVNCTQFTSQSGQDIFVAVMSRGMRKGYFLDIGAYDGYAQSNSHFLEQQLDWDGLCIEAGRNNSKLLRKLGRRCRTIEAVIAHDDGDCLFSEFFSLGGLVSEPTDYSYLADCRRLSSIMAEHRSPKTIDFMSLDIEGAELLALQGFPFQSHQVRFLAVEHNSNASGITHQTNLFNTLSEEGYARVVKDHGFGPDGGGAYEDWYVHKSELAMLDDKPLWMAFRALSQLCKGDTGVPCWEGCWETWDEGWGAASEESDGALERWRTGLLEQARVS